ncbi:MAG: hypothetical protein R2708_08850 [Vicinamibacterales bacterium]
MPASDDLELIDPSFDLPSRVADQNGKYLPVLALEPFVAVVRVRDIRNGLTPDGKWIRSNAAADVLEVLKGDSPDLAPFIAKGVIAIDWPGGSVVVDGRTVNARPASLRLLKRGQSYLVFGHVADGALRIGASAVYEVFNGSALKSLTDTRPQDQREDETLEDVRSYARASVRGQR